MKRISLFLLCLCSITASAQQYISQSKTTSERNNIYKITDKEALRIFELSRASKPWADEKYLHTAAGTYPFGASFPAGTAPGNYVVVTGLQNNLAYEYKPVQNVILKVVTNNYDLTLLLHDKNGKPISNASVRINQRTIPWDARTQTYRIPRYKKGGIIQVYHNQVLNLFNLTVPNRKGRLLFWKKLFPRKKNYYHNEPRFSQSTSTEKKYKGFMAFSKAKYRPGDTLRMKAFIINRHTKPVNDPLLLRLYSEDMDIDTILTTIRPYRPGGYDYEMVLSDSLDLDLDTDYLFTLETLDSRKYTSDNNETDLDDDEYFARRKVLMRGTFEYEEYELKSIRFTARTDVKEHTRGTPVSLFLKATDENDLPVMDGRVTITVTPNNISQYHAPVVFIPHQLWKHEVALDMTGETKVTLPDSIFPAASFSYNISTQFLNSNNESQSSRISQQYYYDTDEISFTPKGDSLSVDFKRSGHVIPSQATLLLLNAKRDTVALSAISLPAVLPLHPYVNTYRVTAGNVTKSYLSSGENGMIQCNASRTRDSVFADIVNPKKLYFWYSIFAGNKLAAQGYDRQLSWKAASATRGYYFVSLQYIWNDQVKDEHFIIPYLEKQLQVTINNPVAVYPGQTVRIGITVTDAEGRPVKDADVTAYAMTARFNYTMPNLPNLDKRHPMRKAYSQQRLSDRKTVSGKQIMNWDRWKNEMTLDSNAYYRFLHPDGIRYNTEPAKNDITQISPFVTENGAVQFISHVKIDEQPVFFANTDLRPAYSFAVWSGKHKLEIRTSDKKIIIDSIYAEEGLKTFISIAADKPDERVRITKMPTELTPLEVNLYKRYVVPFLTDNNDGYTYINQNGNIQWFNPGNGYSKSIQLAGPLKNNDADYIVKGRFIQSFVPEPGYTFEIRRGLVKETSTSDQRLRFYLPKEVDQPRLYDHVITESEMDSIWNDHLDGLQINQELYSNARGDGNTSNLIISPDTAFKGNEPRQLFLYRYDDPTYIRIYRGQTTWFYNLEPGNYRLLVLLKKNKYYVADSLKANAGGNTYYRLHARKVMEKDSTSAALSKAILDWRGYETQQMSSNATTDFTTPFNNQYLDTSGFTRRISGVITTDANGPVPGASIILKGTRYGTLSNAKGYFSLAVTEKGQLTVNAIGYNAETVTLKDQDFIEIKLKPVIQSLSETVVVGYGTQRKKEITAAASHFITGNLSGVVAGVTIRGTNSINTPPLIIIDGVPYEGLLESLDPSLIKNMSVLKDAAATAIYGARAANGVILITSSKAGLIAAAGQEALPAEANSLRSNFRDDAFWQPRLRTNEKGETSFKVTFPDDITNWKTYALAFTDQGQTGSAQVQIKSYKPLSANLSLPVFAVEGDSVNIIGKVLNYGTDSATVSRSFYTNQVLTGTRSIGVRNSLIDTFPVHVPLSGDSISFKYTITGNQDYFDGEYRAIPVFKKGVTETKGFFAALPADTSFSLSFADDTAAVHLYACTGMLPVLLDEIDYLRRYEYLCNEQLASKLTGLLLEKQARKFLGLPFKDLKKISELIRKLEQNENKDGGWGWWNKSTSVYWVSQHVTKALLMAEKEGFKPNINKAALIDYSVFQLNGSVHTRDAYTNNLTLLETLYELGAKINFPAYLDTIPANKGSKYDQFRLLYLKQQTGIHVNTASLMAARQTTMMGNSYWGEDSYQLFNNDVQLTLLAYKILRAEGGHDALLRTIRDWFMEKRRSGNWRNTYESATILATILPDALQTSEMQTPGLSINGEQVSAFPYTRIFTAGKPLNIVKRGGSTVYFTGWQQHWNPAPPPAAHQFSVSSQFLQQDTAVNFLTAGRAVTLEVTVQVKADADYVMVEIPVPAGCSYEEKNSQWSNHEVHREYFKNKVSIFSDYLNKGTYRFTVSLMPRYTGYYHLNPAKAEMMYFPVFFGREGMKKVAIRGK
ncbi:carboxypeptidase-like regulatory domain-containing protein [Chitinophaga ginsengisegetis]|uniref:alpha-2-macroglobulin family protein n=1 Tax=Chitinophaga ginsengisegetis TaxID=393003 RepID=UPI003439E8DA